MSPTGTNPRRDVLRTRRLVIDPHYTVAELEWDRLVGPTGLGRELLAEMAGLSAGQFNLVPGSRIPTGDGERIEFEVDGIVQSVRFDYDASPTSTLMHGLRHLFGEVNGALRRVGVGWRFVLTRRCGKSRQTAYRLVMVRRSVAVQRRSEMHVVAGLDLRELDLGG